MQQKKAARAVDANGKPISPRLGVIPIIKDIGSLQQRVIGTGFYITRYGLFVTAKHVIDEITSRDKKSLNLGYVGHSPNESEFQFRRIISASFLPEYDLAVCQAENLIEIRPDHPIMNMRPVISSRVPTIGADLATFGYPENMMLDFNETKPPELRCDFYLGKMLKFVRNSENPSIKYPHYETSVKIKSGASGGPVCSGRAVIGVNCRGWDFGDNDPMGDLSYVTPIGFILRIEVSPDQIPVHSWEQNQIKVKKEKYTIKELIDYGHILFSNDGK